MVEKTVKDGTDDYWELVDKDLQKIRTAARSDTEDPVEIAKRVARYASSSLGSFDYINSCWQSLFFYPRKDRKKHGSNASEEIPDVTAATDDTALSYQADVDQIIEARSHGQVSSTAALETEGPDGGDA